VIEKGLAANATSHVNRIPGVHLDEAGFVHTQFGTYHPVTGEGLPINAPDELMQKILVALIEDGIESGPAEEFDLDQFVQEMGRD
jgi:hypothetical protein